MALSGNDLDTVRYYLVNFAGATEDKLASMKGVSDADALSEATGQLTMWYGRDDITVGMKNRIKALLGL